jgi:FkbM family methyltransferase
MEVYVSLLLDACGEAPTAGSWPPQPLPSSSSCSVVDVGCNMGLFAAFAVSLGAEVECFEPSGTFAESLNQTTKHYTGRLTYHRTAVVARGDSRPFWDDGLGYRPCSVGRPAPLRSSPQVPLQDILIERNHTALLKIDTDTNDGSLLHVATDLLTAGRVSIDSILVELGCSHPRMQKGPCQWETQNGDADQRQPRGGDVHDLWRLQQIGYDVYRVNTHGASPPCYVMIARGSKETLPRIAHSASSPLVLCPSLDLSFP